MRSFEAVENIQEYADNESPDVVLMKSEEEALDRPAATKKLLPLLRLVAGKPETLKVLEIKLEEPHLSFREVAAKSAMSSSQAHRLLNDAVTAMPSLRAVLGMAKAKNNQPGAGQGKRS